MKRGWYHESISNPYIFLLVLGRYLYSPGRPCTKFSELRLRSNLKNPVSEEVTTEEGSEATDDVVTQISNAEEPEQVTDLDVKNYRYEKSGATW